MTDQPEYHLAQAFECSCGDLHEWITLRPDTARDGWYNVICPASNQTVDSLEIVRWADVMPTDDFSTFRPAWQERREQPPLTWWEAVQWTMLGAIWGTVFLLMIAMAIFLLLHGPWRF